MLIRRLALGAALLAVLLILAAGPGTRLGVWHFRTGFTLLRWGVYAGLAGAALALAALAVPRSRAAGVGVPLAALLLALGAAGVPWWFMRQARGAPPIHDITTDTQDPPAFVAVAPLRADAPNPVSYEGDSIARLQRAAYPDLQPIVLDVPPPQAFARAHAAARDMGWEIVAADSAAGRVEATATTTWFGFRDDVVVRVRAEGAGSRVDVRSKSRVGRGDAGANAARIRAYATRVRGGA